MTQPTPIRFDAAVCLDLCKKYGPLLDVSPVIEGPRVMAAIGAVESGGGDWKAIGNDCGPRHEPAYDRGGLYDEGAQALLLDQYGSDAACSYGPWQTMLVNVPGYTPNELRTDPTACAEAFLGFFNRYIVRHCNARTLSEIGEAYNAGHVITGNEVPPGIRRYVYELTNAYHEVQL